MGILPRLQLASVILPFVLALSGCACDGDPGEGPNGQNGETGDITVSIITPADGESFSPEDTIEFEGLAVDERTGTEIPNSSLVWSSDLSGQIGIGREVLTALPEGSHTVTLTATADDGVEGTASVAIVVAMPAMEVRIVNPRDRDIFPSGESIEFECRARQDGAAVANAQIRWLDDGEQFGLGAVVQTALPDGSRIITCGVTNPLTGEIGEDSIRISVGEPAIRINTPTPGESFDFGETIEFRAQVITSDPAPHNVVWTSDVDGQLGLGQTIQTALASVGLHAITASFTDASGETATDTIVIEYVRPNQAPVVVITRPTADGAELASGESATFEGSALDEEDGDISAMATWFDPVVGEFGTGPEATITNPLPGKYEVTLSVVDSGGAPGQDTRIVYVQPADGGPLMEVAFEGDYVSGVGGSESGVWVAREGAFTRYTAGGQTTVEPSAVALPNGALPVAVATGGGRTAFASDDGLAICTGAPEAFVCSSYRDALDNELGSTEVLALVVLNDGTVVAAGEGGLFVVDPEGQISVYDGGDWNGDDRVNDLDLDAAGVVWMATDDGLVSFNVAAATFTIHPRGGLPATLLRSVAERDGVVWVGHDQGISLRQTQGAGQQWRSFGAREGLAQERVLSLDLDSRGVVWGGTDGGGAFRLDPDIGAFLMITPDDGLPGSIVEDTFVDELDVKWFATDGGLGLWYGQ